MLLVQKFLKTHSFKELQEQHGVYASFSKSGHKFSLNYDMIEAKESDPLSQQCRGLILASTDGSSFNDKTIQIKNKLNFDNVIPGETVILARGFDRFFNAGQGAAAEINWEDPKLKVLNKLDGTLILIYKDQFTNNWCVATRGVPEADLLMDNGIFTFRTLFEKAVRDCLKLSFEDLTAKLNPERTYCFELMSPLNRIVVDYKDYSISLLGIRNTTNGDELDIFSPEIEKQYSFLPKVNSFPLSNLEEVFSWVSSQNPIEHEGVVILDSQFKRIKVKNANYVATSKMRDSLGVSQRNCLELILNEKEDDIIPFLPQEIIQSLLEIKEGVRKLIHHYDSIYLVIKERLQKEEKSSKKEFALSLKENKIIWTAPFFCIYDNKVKNMRDFIFNNKENGTWSNSFLDKILDLIKNEQ